MTEQEKRDGCVAAGAEYLRRLISMIESGEVVSFTVTGLQRDGQPVHRTMLADPDHDDWTAFCRLRTEASLIDTAALLNRARLFTLSASLHSPADTESNPVEDPSSTAEESKDP